MKISIEGKEYFYSLDAIFIPSILRVHKKNKGKAIAMIKKYQTYYRRLK